jgi:muramoyltetrapeptide carboxypeptidase
LKLKPPALRPGAHLRLVAPASSARAERLSGGAEALRARGFKVSFGEHAQGRLAPYFSGTAAERLADLHAAFKDPDVDGIICTRGGYGSNYLLPGLDLDLIREHPKAFCGYSDMTALQTWLADQLGLVAFHGPLAAGDFYLADGVDDRTFLGITGGEAVEYGPVEGLRVLRPGTARGILYGGCLSLLSDSLGTPYAATTEGKLLFLEDVGAKPYQLDRMLRQLLLAGKLEGVAGFIFGEMLDCHSPGAAPDLLEQVILRVLDPFPGPIAIGLRSGHVSRANVTLPLNIETELVLEDTAVLRTLESAVLT